MSAAFRLLCLTLVVTLAAWGGPRRAVGEQRSPVAVEGVAAAARESLRPHHRQASAAPVRLLSVEEWGVAWEAFNHLHKLGLPDPRPRGPACGIDAWGRPWTCDELGFPYYLVEACGWRERVYYQPELRESAARARRLLSCVDWPAAAVGGSRTAVVRGFGAEPGAAVADPLSVRESVRGALVAGVNEAGRRHGAAGLTRLQALVEQGVEDAIIEAFNAAGEAGIAPAPPPASSPSSVDASSPADAPPPQDSSPESLPPPPSAAPASVAPPAAADSHPLDASPQTLRRHLGPDADLEALAAGYVSATERRRGWLLVEGRLFPLPQGKACLVLRRPGEVPAEDVWCEGQRLAENGRYFEFFEDARAAEPAPAGP